MECNSDCPKNSDECKKDCYKCNPSVSIDCCCAGMYDLRLHINDIKEVVYKHLCMTVDMPNYIAIMKELKERIADNNA